jgi:hypothetical protein
MKLCKDCKHCEPNVIKFLWFKSLSFKYAKCKRPDALSLVDGTSITECYLDRRYSALPEVCGVYGKYWEQK